MKIILHVDMDSFYAAVEERENPKLKGKPIAVCMFSGRSENSGAVATANYPARKLGIKSGMPIAFAKKKGGGKAVFLKVNKPLYEEVSDRIMGVLEKNADIFEQRGIDEAFLDVSKKAKNDFKEAKKIAERIKQEIKKKERLTCSAGIGTNKLVAKMASGFQKPDSLTLVEEKDARRFLEQFPLEKLWGIGPKTLERLNEMGVGSLDDLKEITSEKLSVEFGDKKGKWLYDAARGKDESPVEPKGEREQIGRIMTLKEDSQDVELIGNALDTLSHEVFEKFKERDEKFRTVSVVAISTGLKGKSRSKTLQSASRDPEVIKDVARELMEKYLKGENVTLRRVGVGISNFEKDIGQKSLAEF